MAIRVYEKSVATYTSWAALTAYELNDFRVPTVDNGFCYKCTTAGTSGETEPAWTTIVDATVTDGTAVWTCEDKAAAPNPLSAELDTTGKGGYSFKDIWVKSDNAENQEFIVYGSFDGANWRQIDELTTPHGLRDNRHKGLQNAYPFIRVSTAASASNEIEIVAGE